MRSLSSTDRARVVKVLPPRLCKARSVRTGKPCRNHALLGADVCVMHGGRAPQVRRKAAERVTLAQALASGERRHPWQVLEHALHAADVLFREVLSEIEVSPETSAASLEKLRTEIERVHRLARGNLDAGLAARKQAFHEDQAAQMARFVERVVARLEPSPEQRRALPAAVVAEVRALTAGTVDGEVVGDAR